MPRGGAGNALDGRWDHMAPRGSSIQRHRAATLGGTFDVHFARRRFVASEATAESAHSLCGQRVKAMGRPWDAREPSPII